MSAYNQPLTEDKVDGQHWTTVRELWMKKDKEQCESWKDEVQNVLIFSGLFSAIVTAFLIESQKALRPDPAEESVQLLRQIAAQSAGQMSVALVQPRIENPPISIWINVFWFLSLVLSLTTALIGIVSLQWIRTHLRCLGEGSESLGLSHMHSRGLEKSYIPLIFASLPVILILGLTFFLIGLVIFLFELSWPVAIPIAIAIMCTFTFLLITTAHPGLQPLPAVRSSGKPDCFPSLYRSPQSLLFLQFITFLKRLWLDDRSTEGQDIPGWEGDWTSRSQIWLHEKDLSGKETQLRHLGSRSIQHMDVKPFAYDTIEALVSMKDSKSAESEKEMTALAKCLAEVLPIHLDLFQTGDLADLFPTGDLADLIPFLPPSKFVPSSVFLFENTASWEDLSAVALLQIATCKGQSALNAGRHALDDALVRACVLTTRWLFKQPRTFDSVPESQPLDLISKPLELSLDVLEVLIATLTRFFSFAADFKPDSQAIGKTTHMSSYTYWFLVRSAEILTQCSLPQCSHPQCSPPQCLLSLELQNRHAYILDVIAFQLGDENTHDYLFLTASIYAGIIAVGSSPICSLEDGRDFLRAVKSYSSDFSSRLKDDLSCQRLCETLRHDEVAWAAIDQALG